MVFENVFDIIVFVNSMKMHFPKNLHMLFMTMPSVKKMYHILHVQRLKNQLLFALFDDFGITPLSQSSFHFKVISRHLGSLSISVKAT